MNPLAEIPPTVNSTSTILVVDDNPATLKATARVLTQAGYEVATANDGTEALRQVRTIRPALVLLDVVLPDLGGTEVVRRIRADPHLADTTLVLLSAQQISPEQQAAGLDIGADGYIARPIANAELVARVRLHLRQNDLQQVTQSLYESEERFRMLLQSVPTVAIQGYGVDGAVQYWNDASERFYGYTREEALGGNLLDLIIPPEMRDGVTEALRGVAEEQRDIPNGELTLMRKDGSRITVFSSHAVLRRSGHPPELFCIDVDLSERMMAEQKLAKTNRALRMLSRCNEALMRSETESELLAAVCRTAVEVGGFRMAWVGFALDDTGKTIVPQAHQGAENGYLSEIKISWDENDSTGRGPAGRVIRSGEPVVIPDLATDEGFRPWLKAAQAHGFRAVINLPLKDVTRTFGVLGLTMAETGEPLPEDMRVLTELANNLAFGISNLRGRAERRLAQRKIAEQASLLDKARDAILMRDLEHRITYWNQSAERLYGWTAHEALGQSAKELFYQDPSDFMTGTETTLKTGEWVGELTQTTKSGRNLMVEGHWSLVRDDDGAPQGILCINTDITNQKKLEQQFLRAQRMESIGTLAGGIAHDLNNVLAPIMMSIDLLKLKATDQSSQKILETISYSTQRGAEMVSQVLSFARGIEGQRVAVDLKQIVKDLVRIVSDTFPKNIIVDTRIDPKLWSLRADPTQLHQVLLNLCVNARDAMPDGGHINLSVENTMIDTHYAAMNIEARVGQHIKIEVQDTGTGIPSEIIDKVFDPFFTTKELGKGTGLGLSTSLAIIKSHGGFIRAYSEPDMGTRFRIYLPARDATGGDMEWTAEELMPRGNGETVLVIDDEAAIRQITAQTLESFGYQALTADNGAEAVALYASKQDEIAVVLTDMMMPIMDGPATIRALRKLNPSVRIIGASGIMANGKVAQAAGAGVKHFIPKPYTAETLLKVIAQILKAE